MQKSHWYLMFFKWLNGIPTLGMESSTPASLQLTTGYSTTPQNVPRLEINKAFRTLGIYVTPNGSQHTQFTILCQYAIEYASCVSTSKMTSDEAFCSYMMHLHPKLIYPLACSSLMQVQCRSIQAPAMAALLPKMHLNRHTPHAVLYGERRYGGLNFPDLYTDQGFGQLRLLIGHLKLAGDTGNLILVAVSHTQLHIGSCHPMFHLKYSSYPKWIDHTWLTSIWKYLNQLDIQLDIEHAWTPTTSPCQHSKVSDAVTGPADFIGPSNRDPPIKSGATGKWHYSTSARMENYIPHWAHGRPPRINIGPGSVIQQLMHFITITNKHLPGRSITLCKFRNQHVQHGKPKLYIASPMPFLPHLTRLLSSQHQSFPTAGITTCFIPNQA